MKRLLLILLLVLVAAAGGGWAYLDSIAKSAIEKAGTEALGVETRLGNISLSLLKADVGIADLRIGNPPGFRSPHFFDMRKGYLSVTAKSLLSDEVHIPEITLDGIDVYLDKEGLKSNYGIILDNAGKSGGESPSGGSGEPEKPGKKFRIDRVVITNITAHADLLGVGGNLSRVESKIDRIELTDISSDKGADMSGVIGKVIRGILRGVFEKGTNLPKEVLEGLGEGLKGVAGTGVKVVEGAAEKVKEGIGGLLGK